MEEKIQPITTSVSRWKGVIAGILGAGFFGFIPVFSKPVLEAGLSPACLLFYRFFFASILIATISGVQGKSISLPKDCWKCMSLIAVFYCFSGGFLVLGLKYMSGGVTEVLHFTYPIWVMLILLVFFKEKIRVSSALAIIIAIVGIYCLGVLGGAEAFMPGANRVAGVIIVVASGLACGSYIVAINKSNAHKLSSMRLSFWMLSLSAIIFLVLSVAIGTFEFVTDLYLLGNLVGLALIATVLSNIFQVYSIKYIGSTQAAIIGAVEPATGVVLCIILFGEVLNLPIILGIVLIFTSVMIVVTRNK